MSNFEDALEMIYGVFGKCKPKDHEWKFVLDKKTNKMVMKCGKCGELANKS